jgi:hypothetical protein
VSGTLSRKAKLLQVEQSEIYFRTLDRLTARESFLEKEMLDADIHHLEVRTSFFDKLAVLSAGSLAVGISFMASGYQRDTLQHVIHQHLWLLSIGLVLVLFSLILCVVHNYLTSLAVSLLSKQLEHVYKGAQRYARWHRSNPNGFLGPSDPTHKEIMSLDDDAELAQKKKAKVVARTVRVGTAAIIVFILGYAIGLAAVMSIIAHVK